MTNAELIEELDKLTIDETSGEFQYYTFERFEPFLEDVIAHLRIAEKMAGALEYNSRGSCRCAYEYSLEFNQCKPCVAKQALKEWEGL